MEKMFVDVICYNHKSGDIEPLFLMWKNNRKIPIKKVIKVDPLASLKAGFSGIKYTCLFSNNEEKHLYYDRGKWFVEVFEHEV